MINRFCPLLFLTFGLLAVNQDACADERGDKLFTLKVLPILKDKCLGCHGGKPDDVKGEFQVTSRKSLLKGGESGDPSIVPGKPDEGTLMESITWSGLEMPPKENDRLTSSQIQSIREWIRLGAVWPDEETQAKIRKKEAAERVTGDGIRMQTSGGTSEEWTNRRYQPQQLWAFLPLRPSEKLLAGNVNRNQAIDFFINRRLKESGLTPSVPASPGDLIRRAALDLTGLPPSLKEVREFETAYAKDRNTAWSGLIDRLLESPRYGEKWGRHWLDVTRYADTGGMSNDFERSNLWRYRDYVIRSFNEDKPYNQFVMEQIAGDELADQSVAKRLGANAAKVQNIQLQGKYNEQESEWIVATGFLRLGPWDNAMITAEEARQIYLDDLVNITGQTFLSQTLRCCKCHDHKFDPIPTRDYYRIYSAFSTTQMAERPVPFLPSENLELKDEGKQHVQRMLEFAVREKNRLIEKRETAARAWFKQRKLPYRNANQRNSLPDDQKPPRHVGLDHVEQGQLKVREQDEWIWTRRMERFEPMAQSVFNAESYPMAWNGARKLRIRRVGKPKNPVKNFILVGGALTAPGDPVQPGVLSAVSVATDAANKDPYLLPSSTEGRRLGLATWIVNPENPLTSRSIVNRIWQHHFGTGIARNANNFGAKGAAPTHPDLLDFLATDFVEGGWKIKRLHRLIMMSDAYRRSTRPASAETIAEKDPDNRLLSCFPRRRLSAEEIRDSILAITGELVHRQGGLPVMPEINMEVALQPRMIQFSLAPAYQPSRTPQQRNRRTIYAYHVRGQADPFTDLFNQPNPNESCEIRETAAVTTQAFTLMNSDAMTDRAIAMAMSLLSTKESPEQQVHSAFQRILLRNPAEVERKRLVSYLAEMREYHTKVRPQKVQYPTEIVRSLVEEFSGRPFTYREILPVFSGYVPDRKPSDVDADTRALADLCLILFNTNEFMYVE